MLTARPAAPTCVGTAIAGGEQVSEEQVSSKARLSEGKPGVGGGGGLDIRGLIVSRICSQFSGGGEGIQK